ncbi:MAG TPA: thioredoxin-disulfide reductase [Deltaproteobacteria bacterium]|nr:thioredoxin-disulfide reductase [Deltaproteobacteria bacterium]
MYDIIIIGSGPAGLTAGIYASRANMKTLMIASTFNPSLITTTDLVENYPGFPDGITGFEIIERFTRQATKFGMETAEADVRAVSGIPQDGSVRWKVDAGDKTYEASALIIATGTQYAHLNVPGEEEFTGRGVSYCATCDGAFYRERDVVVIGGGDTAVQEALFLTRFADTVTIVHRRDRLRATGILTDRASANAKIRFEFNSVVEKIIGDTAVTGVIIRDVNDPAKKRTLRADGAFIFTGTIPNTAFLGGLAQCDDAGYIKVDQNMRTSTKGIFACGDCTTKLLRQVVTACGDGATAAFAAEHYINDQRGTSYEKWKNSQ